MKRAMVLLCLCPGTALHASTPATLPYQGISLAGAEFGVDPFGKGALPGVFGVHYMYPSPSYAQGYESAQYFVSKGMTVFRLPFRWERLQPVRNAPFNADEFKRLTTTVDELARQGATVILDPHNYARYGTALIGSKEVPNSDFADLWKRLAEAFQSRPNLVFGLMNEPHDMPTEQWVAAANAAIAAIRTSGANNLILVPGNGWSGARSWTQNWYGTANATAMLNISDPKNNIAFEAHQYLDADGGGSSPACVSPTIGSERLAEFTQWLKANGKKGFIGEFGAGSNQVCLAALDDMIKHIEAHSDVYLGWAYWAGGPRWGNHWMAIEPKGGADAPQMNALSKHLNQAQDPKAQGDCMKNYDAGSMNPSVGAAVEGGWNLWSNGSVSISHDFAKGPTRIAVKAKGSSAAGAWPHMRVEVGGVAIAAVSVQSRDWKTFTFDFAADGGPQEIQVSFDNDFVTGTEDRNLYLATVDVSVAGSQDSDCQPVQPSPKPGDGTALRIMPLGDSITLGVNGGYRNGLWKRLAESGRTIDYVGSQSDPYAQISDKDHEGHPGFTITQVAQNADNWLDSSSPSYVLLMIGTNDVAWWSAQNGQEIADRAAVLMDQILADHPNVWIVAASIPPLSSHIIQPNNVDRAQLGRDYNAALKKRVDDRIKAGRHIRFADVYSALSVADLYDGVHPSLAAADKVAQVWYDALLPILPKE